MQGAVQLSCLSFIECRSEIKKKKNLIQKFVESTSVTYSNIFVSVGPQ